MARKRWADLPDGQKIMVIVLGALQIGLMGAALWDIAHRRAEEVRGDRRMWAGLAFINWIGPLAYFTIGRREGLRCPCCCCAPRPAAPDVDTESL